MSNIKLINKNMEKAMGDDVELLQRWNSKEIQNALKKALKDSGKPVKKPRALSAYNFFCKQENHVIREANPELKTSEIMGLLGQKWKILKESTDKNAKNRLEEIQQLVIADKKRVTEEREQIASDEESSDIKKKYVKKRGTTAYMFFCTEERLNLEVKGKEAMKELGRLWRELSESNKSKDKKRVEKYKKMAEEDKQRVLEENKKHEEEGEEEGEEEEEAAGDEDDEECVGCGGGEEEEEDAFIFDYSLLSKFIFDLGGREDVLVRNRRFLYELSQIVEEVSNGAIDSCCQEGESCCN